VGLWFSLGRFFVGDWLPKVPVPLGFFDVERLVNRNVGSISSIVLRLSERMQESPTLADRVWSLKVALGKQLNDLED